jgi:hypothetical protein
MGALNKHQMETENKINRDKWIKDKNWQY